MELTKRQKRLYSRVLSGIHRPGATRLMTLTSSPDSPTDIHRSFRSLKERIRRRFGFEYIAVVETTTSGLLHLHILYRGDYIPQAWLSNNWQAIHRASVVWISKVKIKRGVAGYLMKYLGKGMVGRWWSSWGWIYRGWRIVWKWLVAKHWECWKWHLPRSLYDLWNRHLEGMKVWLGDVFLNPPLVKRKG